MAKNYYPIILIIFLFISCDDSPTQQVVGGGNQGDYTLNRDTVVPNLIFDGDTFRFTDSEFGTYSVRILDLDTYETSFGDRLQDQAKANNISIQRAIELANEAKNWAIQNILNREVVIYRKYNRNTDSFDRLLRKVEINGKSYDSIMKANNWHTGFND